MIILFLLLIILMPVHAQAIDRIVGTAVNVSTCTLNIIAAETLPARANTAAAVSFWIDPATGLWFDTIKQTAPVQTARIEKGTLFPLGFISSSANISAPFDDLDVIGNSSSSRLLTFNTTAGSLNMLNEWDYVFTNIGNTTSGVVGNFSNIAIDGSGVFRTRNNGLGNPVVLERYNQTAPYTRTAANGPNLDVAGLNPFGLNADLSKVNLYQPNDSSTNAGKFVGSPLSFTQSFSTSTTTRTTSSAIDNIKGFAYFSSNQDLRQVRLSDFVNTSTISATSPVILECCNLVVLDTVKNRIYWAVRTTTPTIDIYRVNPDTFTVEQRFITALAIGAVQTTNALQIDTANQRLYYQQQSGMIAAFSLCQ